MNTLISVDDLTYYYPQEKNPVLKDVSFKVNKGDVLGSQEPPVRDWWHERTLESEQCHLSSNSFSL